MCAGFGISSSRTFRLTSSCTSEEETSSQLAVGNSRTTGLCVQITREDQVLLLWYGLLKEIPSCCFHLVRAGIDFSRLPGSISVSALDLRHDDGREQEGTCL